MNKDFIELENNRYLSNSTEEIKIINSSIGRREVINYLELENELETIEEEIHKMNNLLSNVSANAEIESYIKDINSDIKGILSNLKRLKGKRNKHLVLGTLFIAFLFCFWFNNWEELGFEMFTNINNFALLITCTTICSVAIFTNFSKGIKDIKKIRNEKKQIGILNKNLSKENVQEVKQHLAIEYQKILQEIERLEKLKRDIESKLHKDYMVVEETLLEGEDLINSQVKNKPKVRKLKLERNNHKKEGL